MNIPDDLQAARRLRAVLMTMRTTILGLLSLALDCGERVQAWKVWTDRSDSPTFREKRLQRWAGTPKMSD